jgi:glutathionylspermidine amidase/synthetase
MEASFGEIIGSDFIGIKAYSCNNCLNENTLSFIQNDIYCGVKWQCIEYIRRWLIINFNISFDKIDTAYMMFYSSKLKFFNILSCYELSYIKNYNGQSFNRLPQIGSIIIWDKTNECKTGHSAIVSKVTHDYIYISEQNFDNIVWNHPYSRKIKIEYLQNHSIYLDDTNILKLFLLGWLIII